MRDATKYANDIAKEENDKALAAVKAAGKTEILTLTPDARAAWRKVLLTVHRDQEGRIGKDIVQEVYRETGFKP